jgi:hypothetical protein
LYMEDDARMDQRMSVTEAAHVLNLSEAAVRARIGESAHKTRQPRQLRDEDGNVFVMVDPDAVDDAPRGENGTDLTRGGIAVKYRGGLTRVDHQPRRGETS